MKGDGNLATSMLANSVGDEVLVLTTALRHKSLIGLIFVGKNGEMIFDVIAEWFGRRMAFSSRWTENLSRPSTSLTDSEGGQRY